MPAVIHQEAQARTMSEAASKGTPKITTTIDVRVIPHQDRHPLIFHTYEGLKPGEAFVLMVDHDPKPLYFELDFVHKGKFTWDYLEQGPRQWRVQVAKTK